MFQNVIAKRLTDAAKMCNIASLYIDRNLIMKLFYKLSTYITQIAASGILLLSVFACSSDDTEASMAPGSNDMLSPTNNYTLNGKVVSAANEQAGIPNILVEISIEKNNPTIDTLFTNANGLFEWMGAITTFGDNAKLHIATTDTTGKYKKNSMVIEFNENDISQESNTWFLGEAEKTLTIKLEEN